MARFGAVSEFGSDEAQIAVRRLADAEGRQEQNDRRSRGSARGHSGHSTETGRQTRSEGAQLQGHEQHAEEQRREQGRERQIHEYKSSCSAGRPAHQKRGHR